MTMPTQRYFAIYDFKLLPYALGDVLTWNVQTAVRCAEAGRVKTDVHVCLDPGSPASIYQGDLINGRNCGLFFSELYGAFGTHPRFGDLHIYADRTRLLAEVARKSEGDEVNREVLTDYEAALAAEGDNDKLVSYFMKYIYSHQHINDFYVRHGDYPRLQASFGCEPDVNALFDKFVPGKFVVVIHPRLRRLDAGYQGDHTYFRDSDFLEWYDFLRATAGRRPDVQFVVVGRLQEKPLEFLRLPNVISLRPLGMGLGHELTLMLRANLFIGTSSGFAAMVNFSHVPYFVTKMNRESYRAYEIEEGADRLPFADRRQILTAEPESAQMLTRLLEEGLAGQMPQPGETALRETRIRPKDFVAERAGWLGESATTWRYFIDDVQADQETAFLVAPRVNAAEDAVRGGEFDTPLALSRRLYGLFPRLRRRHSQLARVYATATNPARRSAIVSAIVLNRWLMQTRQLFRSRFDPTMETKPPRIVGVTYFPWRDHPNPVVRKGLWFAYLPVRAIVSARRGTLGSDIYLGAKKVGQLILRRNA